MRFTATAMAIGLLALAGCGGDGSTGPSTADFDRERSRVASELSKQKQKAVAKKNHVAKQKPAASGEGADLGLLAGNFDYDPTGKRDPFRSYEWERPDRMDDDELRGPLEQYELGQLDLVAVVWKTGNARALVQDPSGQSYIIAEGARIGKNDGRVVQIGDNQVVVKERYVDFLGQETTKDIQMQIRQGEGG